jgi:hypothetical protein
MKGAEGGPNAASFHAIEGPGDREVVHQGVPSATCSSASYARGLGEVKRDPEKLSTVQMDTERRMDQGDRDTQLYYTGDSMRHPHSPTLLHDSGVRERERERERERGESVRTLTEVMT